MIAGSAAGSARAGRCAVRTAVTVVASQLPSRDSMNFGRQGRNIGGEVKTWRKRWVGLFKVSRPDTEHGFFLVPPVVENLEP